jgi:uncharacterized membrane protein
MRGKETPTAAVALVPRELTKKVSAILYKALISMITAEGIARPVIRGPIGAVVILTNFSFGTIVSSVFIVYPYD